MGDSRPEGERNFWNGRESVTATKTTFKFNAPNIKEMNELRGEGGSDVFTSTRHINNTPDQNSSKAFKINFWSNDDSPLIRPILDKSVYRAPPVAMATMESPKMLADGYGGAGCEKVTPLMLRTNFARAVNVLALCAAGLTVFGALLYIKKPVANQRSP